MKKTSLQKLISAQVWENPKLPKGPRARHEVCTDSLDAAPIQDREPLQKHRETVFALDGKAAERKSQR